MSNRNLLSGRDRELYDLAELYESAKAEGRPFYLDANDLADLADWYGSKKKHNKAIEVVDYGLKLHPDNSVLLIEKAYLYLDINKKEEARQIAEQLFDKYSSETKILHAHLLLAEGKLDETEKLLESLEDKNDLDTIIDISYMFLDMGYPEKAIEWLCQPNAEKHEKDELFIAVLADCYYAQGLIEEAVPLYNQLIDTDPYSAPYWFGLGRCYFELLDFEKSIEACEYALISDDDFAEAYALKGHCFYQLRNEEAAFSCYREAEKRHGMAAEYIYMYMGLCKVSKGEWEEGYENLSKAIELVQSGSEEPIPLSTLYTQAGLCLFRMGEKEDAHEYCKRAYQIDPEDSDSHIIEGRIYLEEGNWKKGISQWSKALKISPVTDTWHDIGMHSMEIGELEYAKIAFEEVQKQNPEYGGLNEKLTILYMALRDKDRFLQYNQKCTHPFEEEELNKMLQFLESENQEDVISYMQQIIKALQA